MSKPRKVRNNKNKIQERCGFKPPASEYFADVDRALTACLKRREPGYKELVESASARTTAFYAERRARA